MLKSKIRNLSLALVFTVGLSVLGAILQPSTTAFAIGDATGTTANFSDILKNQQTDGGWRKYYDDNISEWRKSSIDNKATYTEIRRLSAEYIKTKDSSYSAATIKGINFLLNMQYQNGGWPQVYQSSSYHTHITYNDDAMINVMILLDEVANRKGDFSFIDSTLANRCKISVAKGVDCLLKTQVLVNGKLTVWGPQHDEVTLVPAGARAYELPSLCAKESVNIVNFLKTRPTTTQIATSIKSAEDWFKTSKITGIQIVKANGDVTVVSDPKASPIWARFYDLKTNQPMFVGRDGIAKTKLSDIDNERRIGYSWYGAWPSALVK